MNIEAIFDKYYNGEKNFMTPHVYGHDKKHLIGANYLVFEKSEGEGLFGTPLFGCSVLLFNEEYRAIKNIDLSKAFKSKEEVDEYIDSLTSEQAIQAEVYGETKYLNHCELLAVMIVGEF